MSTRIAQIDEKNNVIIQQELESNRIWCVCVCVREQSLGAYNMHIDWLKTITEALTTRVVIQCRQQLTDWLSVQLWHALERLLRAPISVWANRASFACTNQIIFFSGWRIVSLSYWIIPFMDAYVRRNSLRVHMYLYEYVLQSALSSPKQNRNVQSKINTNIIHVNAVSRSLCMRAYSFHWDDRCHSWCIVAARRLWLIGATVVAIYQKINSKLKIYLKSFIFVQVCGRCVCVHSLWSCDRYRDFRWCRARSWKIVESAPAVCATVRARRDSNACNNRN